MAKLLCGKCTVAVRMRNRCAIFYFARVQRTLTRSYTLGKWGGSPYKGIAQIKRKEKKEAGKHSLHLIRKEGYLGPKHRVSSSPV